MPKMPTLGPQPRRSGSGRVLTFLILGAIAFGGYRWWNTQKGGLTTAQPIAPISTAPTTTSTTAMGQAAPSTPALAPAQAPAVVAAPNQRAPATTVVASAPVQTPTAAPLLVPSQAPAPVGAAPVGALPISAVKPVGPRHISVSVDGPLEGAINMATSRETGPALTQVVTRVLVWWISVPGDLRRNDKLDIIYEERGSEEPQVDAVRLVSGKFNKTFEAYRFKPEGDNFSRYYQTDGQELESRLKFTPVETYEQITSLIKDGRHHKGVDFKTPVNTPVKTTFAGTITKNNWNWHGNGNCLEVSEATAPFRKALFLHLSELPKTLLPGKKVARGETIAMSGNTGHSFAPHLHYQLMSADQRVLDPFESQEKWRRSLVPSGKPALDAQVQKWLAMMAPPAVATTGTAAAAPAP
jgi:murein DD-endopeptidase MepM/ murein hydrolase activator NlpD